MRILLVSEGKHERGMVPERTTDRDPGALTILVRRMLSQDVSIEEDRLARDDLPRHRGSKQGFYKKAMRWMWEAERRACDAVVLVVDEDGRKETIREIDQAQDDAFSPLKRALGVAIRTFDAWMLADEQALTKVLQHTVLRQRDPEENADPKATCRQLFEKSPTAMTPTQMYAQTAAQADLDILAERCPRGFAPFRDRVARLG